MKAKNALIQGTLILTVAGLLSRCLGFYNRIFLSQFIGAKEVGVYQLIFPIYMLCFSICCQGIETSISRQVAACPTNHIKLKHKILITGIFLSSCLSFVASGFLYFFADFLSTSILKNASCAISLQIVAFTLPIVTIKSCMLGYELGMTHSVLPASTQLVEQITRIFSTYCLAVFFFTSQPATATIATLGMAFGEIFSFAMLLISFLYRETRTKQPISITAKPYSTLLCELLKDSIPLTSNRLVLTLIQSISAVLIPASLFTFYGNQDQALSFYGILTGMVMPFIFFPSALTNSLSVMLMPTISSAKSRNQMERIAVASSKSISYSLLIGIFSCFLFLFYGKELGLFLFHNKMAGELLFMMALLCPFTYVITTLNSILNGLGKMTYTFFHNVISSSILLAFIYFVIPNYGIQGFLWGAITSDLLLIFLNFIAILSTTKLYFHPYYSILKPTAIACISGGVRFLFLKEIQNIYQLFFACAIYGSCVLLFLFLFCKHDFDIDERKS